MKFTDIPSLGMAPGHLTVWRSTTAPGAVWAPDARPASHVQEAHLEHTLASAGDGALPPSWLGIAFDLPPHFAPDAFADALCAWADRHENLRSRLVPSPASSSVWSRPRRETLPTGSTKVIATEVGDFPDGRQLASRIEDLFDREVGPLHWPGYVWATVSRRDATTVYLAADHSLVDGYSVVLTVHEIRTLYARALHGVREGDGTSATALPSVASYLDFAAAERASAETLTTEHPSIVRWRRFLTAAGGHLPEFPAPVKDRSGSPSDQPGAYRSLLDTTATRAFDRICRAAGGDAFTGVLACLAKTGHEMTGEREFRTMAPFHTRTAPYSASLGWYVGMAPIAFPLHDVDSFDTTVRSAVAGLAGVKDMAQAPVPRVTELLGVPLRDPFMVSYMDLRLTPGAREWSALRTIVLRGRSNDPDEVCLWFIRTHEGLTVSYRHPATEAGHTSVHRYIERAHHFLGTVAESGRWDPSSVETTTN